MDPVERELEVLLVVQLLADQELRLADLPPDDVALLRRAAELIDERFALRTWKPV